MTVSLRHRITWIAALAVLAMALAPAISQWLLVQRNAGLAWVAVCSTTGTRWVAVGEATHDQPGDQGGLHAQSHCPACFLTSHDQAPPPAALTVVRLPAEPDGLPFLFLHAPRPLAAWSPALARAPPAAA
jgi:hypothetical protein